MKPVDEFLEDVIYFREQLRAQKADLRKMYQLLSKAWKNEEVQEIYRNRHEDYVGVYRSSD